ncbi:CDP-alcohol phosphatidyltransferase family protein [Frigoribacterium salinisoli]
MTLFDRLFRQDEWRTVPNAITAARLLLLPVFLVLVVQGDPAPAMVVIAVVFVTDFLDGFIARRTGTTSELGRWLDPVADRVTLIVVAVSFALGGLVPWWALVLLLVPDVLLSGFALWAFGGAAFPVTWLGKVRTALLMTGLLVLLVGVALGDAAWAGGADRAVTTVGAVAFGAGLVGHWAAAVQYGVTLVGRWRREGRSAG